MRGDELGFEVEPGCYLMSTRGSGRTEPLVIEETVRRIVEEADAEDARVTHRGESQR